MAAPLYLLLVILPSVLGKCSVNTAAPHFSRSVYDFSVDLIQRVAHDTENHFVASPLSLWTLLLFVSKGAEGTTLIEISKTLRQHPVNCYNKKYLNIIKQITSNAHGTALERGSAIFINEAISVRKRYKRKLHKTGVCKIMTLPFGNHQTVASTINEYVSRVTHNTIQEVVSPNDIERVLLILIDAIYFKGAWSHPFEPSRTELEAPFYDESGNLAGSVSMMHGLLSLRVAYVDSIQASVLELPYGNRNMYSMLIFLPHANSSVATVMDLLTKTTMDTIFLHLVEYPEDSVEVRIPRFKISSNLDNLRSVLVHMGLKTMFDSTQAQFPHISFEDLYVSDVLQKAQIEVSEEGTVASAASAAVMTSRSFPEQFTVNKPFFFMIVNNRFKLPLFAGAYSKPGTF